MKSQMKSYAYIPSENGGKDFITNIPPIATFSDLPFFKTIF